jgi:mRNA-degrading endonuclease RelE of RelBE toxin-antitoxin system
LQQYPNRGTFIPENKKLRHLLFGGKPNIYRIIYAVDKRNAAVNVLQIRHGARTPLPTK